MSRERFERHVRIAKVDEEEGLLYGVVYEPDVEDSQGDVATAEEIEKAAHSFLLNQGVIKVEHDGPPQPVVPVESFIAPVAFKLGTERVKKGTWILVSKIFDETIKAAVREGELTGYSMAGEADKIEEDGKDE